MMDSLEGDHPVLNGDTGTYEAFPTPEGSPVAKPRNTAAGDSDSNSQSFVTLSPPTSPFKTAGGGHDVDPSLLESLDSTSSNEQPKSKLDDPNYMERRKMMDLETPIAPGRERSIEPEESERQDIDLKVDITDRLKHTVKNDSFISYKIVTNTTRTENLFERPRYEVWRRYKDFEWLREILEKTYFTLITPPLPGKQISRFFDHKSETFLDERQKALDKFLKRLAAHPYFSFDKHLKVFLAAEPDVLATHISEFTGSTLKIVDVFSTSVKNATTSFMLKNVDPEYIKQNKYFAELGEKFSNIERVASRLHTDREELGNELEDFSSAMIQWATHEPHLAHPLQKVSSSLEVCQKATKQLNEANAFSLLMTSKEYQLYCAAGGYAVRRRDALQYQREKTADDREKKKKYHDEAAATGKVAKLPKLAEDMQKASLDADKALDDLSQANEMLRVDIEKWGGSKDREVATLMKNVANDHVDYHQKCLSEWENVLKLLKGQTDHTLSESDTPISEHRPKLPLVGSIPLSDQSDLSADDVTSKRENGLNPPSVSAPLSANERNKDDFESSDDLFS